MSKKEKNNAIAILQQVSANMSLAFAISSMFLPRKKRLSTAEIKKFVKHGRIQYTAYEDELIRIDIHNTVLTQAHLDVLSVIIENCKYSQETGYYVAQASFNSLSQKLLTERRDIKNLITDLKNASVYLTVKSESREYHFDIILKTKYESKNDRPAGFVAFFDNSFVLYFYFLVPAFKLPKEMQKIILNELETGEAKALARYCTSRREEIQQDIFSIPCFRHKNIEDKRIRSKIRKALEKDADKLKRLNIFIDKDVVLYKKVDNIRFFVNNNPEVTSFVDTAITTSSGKIDAPSAV